jgi:hypothetical protein
MRAKVLEDIAPYYNYGIIRLAKDEEVTGELAVYLLATNSPVQPLDDEAQSVLDGEPEPKVEPPAELDIDAKADDVLAWVGDNPERAAEALAAEQAKDKPRSTLVKQLEKLAASSPEE